MAKYLRLENKDYEVLECINGDCYIKDKKTDKYYFKQAFFASQNVDLKEIQERSKKLADGIFVALIAMSVLMLAYILFKLNLVFDSKIKYTWSFYFETIAFLIFNIVFHEFAHFLTMWVYGRKVNKIGFKFNFIFPAFFVNTSDSYLLPRARRFFVYYSGIMINVYMIFLVLVFTPQYAYLTRIILWAIMMNVLPIGALKTDGYHIIFNIIFRVNDFKKSNNIVFVIVKYAFMAVIIILFLLTILKLWG